MDFHLRDDKLLASFIQNFSKFYSSNYLTFSKPTHYELIPQSFLCEFESTVKSTSATSVARISHLLLSKHFSRWLSNPELEHYYFPLGLKKISQLFFLQQLLNGSAKTNSTFCYLQDYNCSLNFVFLISVVLRTI